MKPETPSNICSVIRVAVISVMTLSLINMAIVIFAPPVFDRFLRYGMTLPAAISTGINASCILLLVTIFSVMMNKRP